MRVRKHKSIRSGKVVSVKEHERKYRTVSSKFIDRVVDRPEGGVGIVIKGKEYPYPLMPKERVSSLLASKSKGKFYNKNIRGKYF